MAEDAELRALRAEIDGTNRVLADLLQQRARLVERIARRKRALGLPLVDAAREQTMLDELLRDPAPGFPRDELAGILRHLFGCYRQHCLRTGHAP